MLAMRSVASGDGSAGGAAIGLGSSMVGLAGRLLRVGTSSGSNTPDKGGQELLLRSSPMKVRGCEVLGFLSYCFRSDNEV